MRFADWPERLAAFIEATRREPFAWGTNDCILWACGGIAAMTGTDPAARFRQRYRNSEEAVAVIRAEGYPTFDALLSALAVEYGYPEIPVPLARRGDVVVRDLSEGLPAMSCGLCIGRVVVSPSRAGLVRWPISAARKAWSIP